MAKGYILYNTHAGKATSKESVTSIEQFIEGRLEYIDVAAIESYADFIDGLEKDDFIVICGGDGTLNRFANEIYGIHFDNEILYYPTGTGNDFAADLGFAKGDAPFSVRKYISSLPTVEIDGKAYRFINGIGYGIDGYCCEIGDKQKSEGKTDINYTAIAIKGLLFHYKPKNAKITVDGKEYNYKKVWIAPTMFGRYYGGGMIPTPGQRRDNKDGTLSLMLYHGVGNLKALMVFPSIFKGEHVKHTDMVAIHEGSEITVEYDAPASLQIDGETVLGVTRYTVCSAVKAKSKAEQKV